MDELRTRMTFDVVDKPAVPVLWGTPFIQRSIKSIHPAEKRIFLHSSATVPIKTVQEPKSDGEKNASDIDRFIIQNPALW